MRYGSLPTGIVAIACGLLANATTAQAIMDTWVSATGTDAGTCPISSPCKTFAYAYGQTDNHGTINVLSSGHFGPVIITKSISIVADGVEAVVNTAGFGSAIIVNAAGIVVSLRGLTIEGVAANTTNKGISFLAGAALQVRNCVIRKSGTGIHFAPVAGTSELHVLDSTVANTSSDGIHVSPTGSASAKVLLDRVRVENAVNTGIAFSGTHTTGSILATVRDSVSAGHASRGISAINDASGAVTVMVDRSAAVNNHTGIYAASGGATILIGYSTISGNNTGLVAINSGAIRSYGTNRVDGNTNNGAPSSTIAMK